ncbi:methylmalonic aciduria and homocystinuria type D protein [Gloeobacter kilaueensis]|uniref:Uncharacterized protein n=1 Tax=Gloeobacter kilaueensis (strain ATCC BAA-2537 / CCAP 1431/1 / ULC 316 / JS1) TaxID=1183438 RepID=U5QP33_GLOK1|nr:methylmalonic aciduria and homocystinuria type D protein [Gloeobacter kilaueensis]AGY60658.1 hypothetical protein GKIL_4412 [Gloeobacter kilaueensis JS1]
MSTQHSAGVQILWYPAAGLFRGDWKGLLPGWPDPPNSLALFFQDTGIDLCEFTEAAEQAKDAARNRFIARALEVAHLLHRQGYRATVFDPIDGLPVATGHDEADRPRFWSTANWSDIRAVRTVTGFPIEPMGGCHVVVHPQYGRRVYIGSLVSSALYIELMGLVPRRAPLAALSG